MLTYTKGPEYSKMTIMYLNMNALICAGTGGPLEFCWEVQLK